MFSLQLRIIIVKVHADKMKSNIVLQYTCHAFLI